MCAAQVAAWADVIVLAVKGPAALEVVKSLATQARMGGGVEFALSFVVFTSM
jgi:prephenate dehydrogenase